MRDLIISKRMQAIQARTSKLHAQLDDAIHEQCVVEHSATPSSTHGQRRRIVRGTQVCTRDTRIGTDMIGMAYRALTSDPTARLTGSDIKAVHIQAWLDSEYCTEVSEADVQAAMVEYRKSAGALV